MTGTNKDESAAHTPMKREEKKYIRMILVRVEAAKSINSAVVVKHKRKEISLRADICLRGRNFFLQIFR